MLIYIILHFPNNRHVVVDSKMSLTDYERYMNAEDGTPEKSGFLKAHIDSVRAQVKRLARKEYTRYLPEGYNRLKVTTADGGPSIITAARNLLKAGARENKKKKALSEMEEGLFLDADATTMLPPAKGEERE